jgi:dihydrofolate reductase
MTGKGPIRITMLYAVSQNGVIGKGNKLPWHIPSDLKYFKAITQGKPMIMGSNTFSSLPGILPGRKHLVLSRADNGARYKDDDRVEFFGSIDELFDYLVLNKMYDVALIGGAYLYKQFMDLNLVDTIHQTRVLANVDGDVYMPTYLNADKWDKIVTLPQSDFGDTSKDPLPFEINIFSKK